MWYIKKKTYTHLCLGVDGVAGRYTCLFQGRRGIPSEKRVLLRMRQKTIEVQLLPPASAGNEGLVGTDSCWASGPPTSFYTNMSRLVKSLVRNGSDNANQGYRRLWFFSGQLPTPAGEEEFETWMSQGIQSVKQWSVSQAGKQQRLSEGLGRPTAEGIRNPQMGKRDCVAMDYIEALYAVFGRVEKTPDPLYKFNHTHQQSGERL